MVDIVNKTCVTCNTKQSTFNYPNEQKASYCKDCKLENMVDMKHSICITCGLKLSSFYYPGEKPLYCNDCKNCGMVDIINRK